MAVRRLLPLIAGIAAAFVAAAFLVPHSPAALRGAMPTGRAGVVVALGAWVLLTPALFPGTVLALASGLAFGAIGGSALACVGGTLGGCAAFALARHGGGASLARRDGGRLRAIAQRIERRSVVSIAVLRAAPGVPATALHYLCGFTRVPPGAYAAGIALGAAPRTTAYAVIGAGLGARGGPDLALLAGGAGALAVTGAAGVLVARRGRHRARPV